MIKVHLHLLAQSSYEVELMTKFQHWHQAVENNFSKVIPEKCDHQVNQKRLVVFKHNLFKFGYI